MLNTEENVEKLEREFIIKEYNFESCLEQIYYKYKLIFQISIICLSLILIIIPIPEKSKAQISSSVEPTEQIKPVVPEIISSSVEPTEQIKPVVPEIIELPKKINEPEPLVNLYIITHKDFSNNVITNPAYKILCDKRTQLTKNYNLEIIETYKDNILYPKIRGYCEGSKIYYIWKLYKEGIITSKYVGFFHYRRIFPFKNNIPNLDQLFSKYDVIVREKTYHGRSNYKHYESDHLIRFLDESINIIKEKYPEYYDDAKKYLNKEWSNYCNIFIAKKDDFIKWGEFVFGVLFELDRRFNLNTDDDIKKFLIKIANESKKTINVDYQVRQEGFAMERIGNIFYDHHWKKRYELRTVSI